MFALKCTARRAAVALAMVAAIGLPFTVRAGQEYGDRPKLPGSYPAMMKMKAMDVMHMMDADKKGFVTKEEFMKFHEAMFDKMDKDKDGKLSREEWLGEVHSHP